MKFVVLILFINLVIGCLLYYYIAIYLKKKTTIKIRVSDFSRSLGLRYCSISPNSGEEYYFKILNNAFATACEMNSKLEVNLDGVYGYCSSFIDEAFGNLVYDFSLIEVKKRLRIISNEEPYWKTMIETTIFDRWSAKKQLGWTRVITKKHGPWFKLVDGELCFNNWNKKISI